jgi:hypothetical protein
MENAVFAETSGNSQYSTLLTPENPFYKLFQITEDVNCSACRNVGQLRVFNAAHTR